MQQKNYTKSPQQNYRKSQPGMAVGERPAGSGTTQRKEEDDLRFRTKALTLRITKLIAALPKGPDAQEAGLRALRSSACASIAMRNAFLFHGKDHFYDCCGEALSSMDEAGFHLELLAEAEIMPADKLSALIEESQNLTKFLAAIVRKHGQQQQAPQD